LDRLGGEVLGADLFVDDLHHRFDGVALAQGIAAQQPAGLRTDVRIAHMVQGHPHIFQAAWAGGDDIEQPLLAGLNEISRRQRGGQAVVDRVGRG